MDAWNLTAQAWNKYSMVFEYECIQASENLTWQGILLHETLNDKTHENTI